MRTLLVVLILSSLWVFGGQQGSDYRHGTVSVDGIYPYMPDEEVHKVLGPGSGLTQTYRNGTVVQYDTSTWVTLSVQGRRLDQGGCRLLQAGDSRKKAESVLRHLSQDGQVRFEGDRLSARCWDRLSVECQGDRVVSILFEGH